MFVVMDSSSMERRTTSSSERCLDSQLWHACAGAMVQMPPINTKVFYFPQGHAEHAHGRVDFGQTRVPPLIPCRVSSMKYMAEPDTDEVFVKMLLTPLREHELDFEDNDYFLDGNNIDQGHNNEKPASFAKTLTQSDANNGGGFSVPRYCAETIFPRLDYSAEPPVQTIIAKDVHGQCWKFRHIYRGTPRRHLLTTGWSNFVNQKKLVAGDSIVFLRAENGDLCVGIRRAKKSIGGGTEYPSSGWNNPLFGGGGGGNSGGANLVMRKNGGDEFDGGRVAAESVVEAVNCAVNGRPFEVVYYPRASTPEFCVKASAIRAAMQIQWCSGMRFKMPFETEDSSRISWFMGTISSVQVSDPIHWPDSPWRLLQVVWDEPDLLQNVKCVNPWLVELVSNVPTFHHLSPFSPPRKKQRFLQEPDFHHFMNHQQQLPMMPPPPFPSNYILNNIQDHSSSAGIQGARHAQFGLAPSDFPFSKQIQPEMMLIGGGFPSQPPRPACGIYKSSTKNNNVELSCLLSVGNPGQNIKESSNEAKAPHILLFGKLIHTELNSSNSSSASTNGNSVSEGTNSHKTSIASDGGMHQNSPIENSSDGGSPWYKDQHKNDLGAENVNILCMAL